MTADGDSADDGQSHDIASGRTTATTRTTDADRSASTVGTAYDGSGSAAPDERLNVCLVVLDTARAADVDEEITPTLARLGQEGTRFERAFSTAPWTVPSHASLFTGTYPSEHGTHGANPVLDDSLRTLPEAFADAGYETVGVSNNTWITEEFGFDRGFSQLRRGWQYRQSETDMGGVVRGECLSEKIEATRARLFEGNPLVNLANVIYSEFVQPAGDDGAARSVDWIGDWVTDRDRSTPFFCFLNLIEPHVVYDPPREYAERYLPPGATYESAAEIRQDPRAFDCGDYDLTDAEFEQLRGLYRGSLAYVDDQLARLRLSLEAAGEWERTIVVVCGDHGEHVGEHGFFGHQYNLYDTLLSVPLVVTGGAFDGGEHRDDLVQLCDLPDTLLDATGVRDGRLRNQSRGRSLHPDSSATPREAVFAEYVTPQPSIDRLEARFGDLPERIYTYDRRLRSVRTPNYKYVEGDDGFSRLHYLPTDPDESRNVVDEEPAVAARLERRLESTLGPLASTPRVEAEVSMTESTKQRLADLGYR
ncbi:sulfatase family protein [Halovivax gelatinilyticus]|uniref:sulfatase family protein n=1 Tax=Halovivax gelatinilyticus TaxID=2961597 RepID=UPI0020CA5464|nr:sulfatase [Halovivax gelatinilyticus]